MLLVKLLLELKQHLLESLNIFHAKLGHILLEVSLLIVNFVLQLNNLLSYGQLICNSFVEGDADVHRQLKIINADDLQLPVDINITFHGAIAAELALA